MRMSMGAAGARSAKPARSGDLTTNGSVERHLVIHAGIALRLRATLGSDRGLYGRPGALAQLAPDGDSGRAKLVGVAAPDEIGEVAGDAFLGRDALPQVGEPVALGVAILSRPVL